MSTDGSDAALTAKLAAVRRDLEQLSFSVSHNLRAPLRAIDGYARILQEDYAEALDADGRRMLGAICENAARLGEQVGAILDYSRAGRKALEPVRVDMNALFQSVWEQQPEPRPHLELQELHPPGPTTPRWAM